jgi:hypothetical protein
MSFMIVESVKSMEVRGLLSVRQQEPRSNGNFRSRR